jgi:hypothetical protein
MKPSHPPSALPFHPRLPTRPPPHLRHRRRPRLCHRHDICPRLLLQRPIPNATKDAPRQCKAHYRNADSNTALKGRILHVSLVVKNHESIDHFYKDIWGFRLYWQGGSTKAQTDWVDKSLNGTD